MHLIKLLQVGQSGIAGPEETGQTLRQTLRQTDTRHCRNRLVVQGQTWDTRRDHVNGRATMLSSTTRMIGGRQVTQGKYFSPQ